MKIKENASNEQEHKIEATSFSLWQMLYFLDSINRFYFSSFQNLSSFIFGITNILIQIEEIDAKVL